MTNTQVISICCYCDAFLHNLLSDNGIKFQLIPIEKIFFPTAITWIFWIGLLFVNLVPINKHSRLRFQHRYKWSGSNKGLSVTIGRLFLSVTHESRIIKGENRKQSPPRHGKLHALKYGNKNQDTHDTGFSLNNKLDQIHSEMLSEKYLLSNL